MEKQSHTHATAEKILLVAKEIFLAQGFEGTSINDIANKAKINKSLIYHHFSNKVDLWKAVKKNVLEKHGGAAALQVDFPTDSFKNFLTSFVTARFEFYDNNPEIVRLISWQRLEGIQGQVGGIQPKKFNSTIPQLIEFQQRGEVRPDVAPEMIDYMIMTTASMAFMEQPDFFEGNNGLENKKKFLRLLVDSLYLAFAIPTQAEKV